MVNFRNFNYCSKIPFSAFKDHFILKNTHASIFRKMILNYFEIEYNFTMKNIRQVLYYTLNGSFGEKLR